MSGRILAVRPARSSVTIASVAASSGLGLDQLTERSTLGRAGRTPTIARIEVLLLCTANQCRSPMAQALLRHHLSTAGADVQVSSAGLMAGGRPATSHGQAAMAERGLDLSGHVSRQLDRQLVAGADLVIGMAREHIREVAVLDPAALQRSFTLKELVRAATAVGPRRAGEQLASWLQRVGAGRRRDALLGAGHDDAYDVEDPVGRGREDYDATARELDSLLERLVALAWPPGVGAGTGEPAGAGQRA